MRKIFFWFLAAGLAVFGLTGCGSEEHSENEIIVEEESEEAEIPQFFEEAGEEVEAVESGEITEKQISDSVRRILETKIQAGIIAAE